ncbi:MAG: hypothetical protein HC822_26315, partial [Oscillochloris sp.]|nr:hypothetical protein [Oscillochloris sp.]
MTRIIARRLRKRPLRTLLLLAVVPAFLVVSGAAESGLLLAAPNGRPLAISLLSGLSADYRPWPVADDRQAELDPAVIDEAARDEMLRRINPPPGSNDLVPLELPPLPQALNTEGQPFAVAVQPGATTVPTTAEPVTTAPDKQPTVADPTNEPASPVAAADTATPDSPTASTSIAPTDPTATSDTAAPILPTAR